MEAVDVPFLVVGVTRLVMAICFLFVAAEVALSVGAVEVPFLVVVPIRLLSTACLEAARRLLIACVLFAETALTVEADRAGVVLCFAALKEEFMLLVLEPVEIRALATDCFLAVGAIRVLATACFIAAEDFTFATAVFAFATALFLFAEVVFSADDLDVPFFVPEFVDLAADFTADFLEDLALDVFFGVFKAADLDVPFALFLGAFNVAALLAPFFAGVFLAALFAVPFLLAITSPLFILQKIIKGPFQSPYPSLGVVYGARHLDGLKGKGWG